MTYRFLTEASADLYDLIDWYDAQNAGLGRDVAVEVRATITRILSNPQLYGSVNRPPRGARFAGPRSTDSTWSWCTR